MSTGVSAFNTNRQDGRDPNAAGILSLPDTLLGRVFMLLLDDESKRAMHSACSTFNRSPAINAQLTSASFTYKVTHHTAAAWPRAATSPLQRVRLDTVEVAPFVAALLRSCDPQVFPRLRTAQHLVLSGLDDHPGAVELLAALCPRVTALELHNEFTLTGASVERIAEAWPELTSLLLRSGALHGPMLLHRFARLTCLRLVGVDLSENPRAAYHDLYALAGMPLLTHLSVCCLDWAGKRMCLALAEGLAAGHFPALRSLRLDLMYRHSEGGAWNYAWDDAEDVVAVLRGAATREGLRVTLCDVPPQFRQAVLDFGGGAVLCGEDEWEDCFG